MELQPGEQPLRQERLHPGIFAPPAAITLALALATLPEFYFFNQILGAFGRNSSAILLLFLSPSILIGLGAFLSAWATYHKSQITLTTRRLAYSTGFVFRASGEFPLENIDSISIFEPLLGRLTGYGTITITTQSGTPFHLRFIANPQAFYTALQRALAGAKRQPRQPVPPQSQSQDDSRYMPRS